ncbi:antitoxin MazE-like protein [Thauera sp. 63]|uniref:antitoxin MazE-like protein n=1 Tax=Thauera sp. 63 TaxID=497321 RepID=UPI0002CDAC9D|nr:hypothetical protein C664_09455 [Thauera sp. 63]
MQTTHAVSKTPLYQQECLADECRRQSSLMALDPQEAEVLDWLEQVADTDGWGLVKE